MGALREKMIEEIRLRNFSPRTEHSYVSAMVGFFPWLCGNSYFSVSMAEKFLPQLPYNERSQGSQGLAIPLQAAFSSETCFSSRQPSIFRIRI